MQSNKIAGVLAASSCAVLVSLGAAFADSSGGVNPAAEDAYLDVLPTVDVPADVKPIPGAVNEEFRNCRAQWPAEYEMAQSGPEARAMRDIYSLIRVQNVIATRDCSCAGKVATWNDVDVVANALRSHFGVQTLGWQQTKAIAEEAEKLTVIAETMCGGGF